MFANLLEKCINEKYRIIPISQYDPQIHQLHRFYFSASGTKMGEPVTREDVVAGGGRAQPMPFDEVVKIAKTDPEKELNFNLPLRTKWIKVKNVFVEVEKK